MIRRWTFLVQTPRLIITPFSYTWIFQVVSWEIQNIRDYRMEASVSMFSMRFNKRHTYAPIYILTCTHARAFKHKQSTYLHMVTPQLDLEIGVWLILIHFRFWIIALFHFKSLLSLSPMPLPSCLLRKFAGKFTCILRITIFSLSSLQSFLDTE